MRKYTSETVPDTVAKMRKSGLPEVKKDSYGRKRTYFYDFALLENSGLPADIMESIKDQAMKHSERIMPESYTEAVSTITGLKYYIDIDFYAYAVTSDSKNKAIYDILEVAGFRVTTYKLNIYGYIEHCDMPLDIVKYGNIRQSLNSTIIDILIA